MSAISSTEGSPQTSRKAGYWHFLRLATPPLQFPLYLDENHLRFLHVAHPLIFRERHIPVRKHVGGLALAEFPQFPIILLNFEQEFPIGHALLILAVGARVELTTPRFARRNCFRDSRTCQCTNPTELEEGTRV